MLNKLLQILQGREGRSVVPYRKYIENLAFRTDSMVGSRFLKTNILHSDCVKMFRSMLGFVALGETVDKDDYEIFMQLVEPQSTVLRKYFDPVYRSDHVKGLISNADNEYIISTSCVDPLTTLPMNKPWAEWQKLRCFWILNHNVKELVTDLFDFQVTFKDPKNSWIVAAIDTRVLSMKYIKYAKECHSMGVPIDTYNFIQSDILYPIQQDLRRIFITNIFNDILIHGDYNLTDYLFNTTISPVSQMREALDMMLGTYEMLKDKKLNPETFLGTKWIPDDMNFFSYCKFNAQYIEIPPFRPYYPMKLLYEVPLMNIVVNVCKTYDIKQYSQVFRPIKMMMDRMEWGKPVDAILTNPKLKLQVATLFDNFQNSVDV